VYQRAPAAPELLPAWHASRYPDEAVSRATGNIKNGGARTDGSTAAAGGLPWWRRWQTTLLAAFLLVALAATLALVADVASDYHQAESGALAKQHDTAVALSRATRLFVGRYVTAAELTADAIARQTSDSPARAAGPALARLHRAHPETRAYFVDPAGRVVAGVPAGVEGLDVAGRDYFHAVQLGAASVVSDLQPEGGGDVVVAAAVRRGDGLLRGVVAAAFPAAALAEELRVQLSGDARALVVDRTGRVIVHGAHPYLDWPGRDFSKLPLVAEALGGRAARSAGFVMPNVGPHLGAMVPVEGLGWAVGVVQPLEAALAPAQATRSRALWVVAAVLGLGLALALLLSAWLCKPIETLAAGVAAIAGGDLAHRVSVGSRNELGLLAAQFNAMADRLQATVGEAESALAEARTERQRLTTTLESLPDGVLVCDAGGVVAVANEAARKLLGVPYAPGFRLLDPAALRPVARTLGGDPLPPDALPLRRALRGERVREERLAVEGPGGGVRRYLAVTAVPVVRGGEPIGAVAVLRDVTDQQTLDALKDQFIARASHELRTPLTAVRGTLGFLRRGLEGRLSDTMADLLAIAARNADQMLWLIDDLLDASRLANGVTALKRERVAIGDLVAQTVRLLGPTATEKGVAIDVRVDPAAVCDGDPVKLEQVLANLVGNAIKFTPPGTRVTLESIPQGGEVEIRVRDQGVGLAPEHLERVFDPFFQVEPGGGRRRERGTGLGLTIARSLVDLHGGRIWAESEGLGRGSLFVVRLPCRPCEQQVA
jgi:signal transduction histidine kinase